MIRSNQWKLWVDQEIPGKAPNVALFDLETDPGEIRNLADNPAHEETRDRLLNNVTEGWYPDTIRKECIDLEEDYRMIVNWGKAIHPEIPEQLKPPPPEIEDDVQIL